jgi:hypothetical protein
MTEKTESAEVEQPQDAATAQDGGEQQRPADPLEEIARESGWVPREEWRGKAEDWREPREFVAHGMKRSREGADELRQMRQSITGIARAAEGLQRRAVEEARREAEARLAGAVENKDHEGVRAAAAELAQIEHAPQTDFRSVVSDFQTRNSWYGQDDAATALAQATTARLAAQGVAPDEQLRQAEEAVRRRFPEHFGQQRQASKLPASVNAPDTRAADTRSRAKTFATLPADAQRAGHDFVKRGMVKTLDDYAKVYYEENA